MAASDQPSPPPPTPGRQHIAVAVSGGGHRASLFALGAIIYLVDAGKGPELAAISSVSGGSLTNAWLGLETDLTRIDSDDFEQRAGQLARTIALGGTLWACWLTYAVLAVLALIVAAAIVATIIGGSGVAWIAWPLAVLAFGVVAKQRSLVARYCFDRVLFEGRPLTAMHDSVDHVICAADLQTAEHVYFSSDFVYSWRTGRGDPAGLSVSAAAQASAALPGAFPPVSLPLAPHQFPKSTDYDHFLLTDGGAYDNMGSEWIMRLQAGFDDGGGWANEADEAVVVNSSGGKGVLQRKLVTVPVVGEIMALLAAKDILYDQSTAVRRRLLNLRYRIANQAPEIMAGEALKGTTIQIDRSPYGLASSYARFDDEAGTRAKAALAVLELSGSQEAWQTTATANARVKTTLSRIPMARAAALLRHAYVLTMVNCHVTMGYPLLDIPTEEESEQWLQ